MYVVSHNSDQQFDPLQSSIGYCVGDVFRPAHLQECCDGCVAAKLNVFYFACHRRGAGVRVTQRSGSCCCSAIAAEFPR